MKSTASILPIRRTPEIRAPASASRLGSKVFSVATPGGEGGRDLRALERAAQSARRDLDLG